MDRDALVERMAEAIANGIDWMPDMCPRSYLTQAARAAPAVAEPDLAAVQASGEDTP